jgi:2-polyprenyl-6-hydroxyphenyl methylase / 3-demethylubiquinone-9 3-methyltransferase
MITASSTVDPAEVERFARTAAGWWDPKGEFRPLHKLNPLRLGWLRDTICTRIGRDPASLRPLDGLTVLDVGCGGGLVSEPLARMGAAVTGLDAEAETVRIAAAHAAAEGVAIDYRAGRVEDLPHRQYDAVVAMEVVEHVADLDLFVRHCADRLAPGGTFLFSTLNRTPKSLALGIVAAEWVLRWVPRGTHDWRKFRRPSEMAAALRRSGLAIGGLTGVVYDPFGDRFRLSQKDMDVNWMGWATAG